MCTRILAPELLSRARNSIRQYLISHEKVAQQTGEGMSEYNRSKLNRPPLYLKIIVLFETSRAAAKDAETPLIHSLFVWKLLI